MPKLEDSVPHSNHQDKSHPSDDKAYHPDEEDDLELEEFRIEPAEKGDLIPSESGEAFGFALPKGKYLLIDPEVLLEDLEETSSSLSSWERWLIAANTSPREFGCDGECYSARVNGHAVSAITTYVGAGKFRLKAKKWITTQSGLIAAVPAELADELCFDGSDGPFIKITKDSEAFYSDSSHNIYFGDDYDVYTGYTEDR